MLPIMSFQVEYDIIRCEINAESRLICSRHVRYYHTEHVAQPEKEITRGHHVHQFYISTTYPSSAIRMSWGTVGIQSSHLVEAR
jgi:hypothetical protein